MTAIARDVPPPPPLRAFCALRLAAALALLPLARSLPAQVAPRDTTARDSLPRADLPAVTVSVARSQAPLRTLPFAVATVEREELLRGRATLGLDEALVTVPGVVVANRYNYALDQLVSIRGFGARSAFGVRGVKVLLDGIPQTLPDGQGQLSNVEVDDLDRVEVLRGPSSSLYGNASGGVISLTTAARLPAAVAPEARLTVGEFDLLKWAADATVPLGPGAVHAAVTRTTVDGHRAHSRADVRHFRLRLVEPLGTGTRLTALAYVADAPLAENPGALTREELESTPGAADPRNVTANARKLVTQVQTGASLSHEFPSGGLLEGAAYAIRRDLENPLVFSLIELDRWAYGVRATMQSPPLRLGIPQIVTVGLDAQWQRDDRLNFTPDGTTLTLDQGERVLELGPFVQTRLLVAERLTVTAGLRYDRVAFEVDDRLAADGDNSGDDVMAAVSWSAGAALEVTEKLAPYVAVSTAFETPTTTELVNRPEGGGGLNPAIEPQRATSYEVGVRGSAGGVLDYSMAAFQADVRDELIPFEVPSEPGRRFFRNAGSARHRGLEVGITARPVRGLAIVGAYTYAHHRFRDFQTEDGTFDGNEIPGVPRHRLHASARYRSPIGLWGAVDNTYTSAYFVDDANSAENAAWWVTDLRVGWDGRLGGWRVAPFLGALNLRDTRYAGSVVVNARGGRFYEPAPGRNVYVGLEVGRWRLARASEQK